MSYNLAISPASSIPIIGNSFIMPSARPIVGGNVIVPSVNPLMGNYVIPTTNVLNGNVVIPTTSHVINPSAGLVMGGGYICQPSLVAPSIPTLPGWNPMIDHSRKMGEIVEYLGKRYEGLLRCKKCRVHISLEYQAIMAHDQQCLSSVLKAKPMPNTNQHSSTINEFKKFLLSCPAEIRSVNVNPPPIEWIHLFLTSVDRTSFLIRRFECLSCPIRGDIEQWQDHVSQKHKLESIMTETEQLFEITCICFICNSLLLGTKTSVWNHTHQTADVTRCINVSNAVALYPQINSSNGYLSRYHKFIMKGASQEASDSAKMTFFCSACDFYGTKNVEKHFSSFEHNMRSVVSDELRLCEGCNMVLSSDALLMAVHRLTPSHLLRKLCDATKTDTWIETNAHQKLLELVQLRFDEHHIGSVSQRLAYFCDMCDFAGHHVDNWRMHMSSEEHRQSVATNTAVKLAEFVCISCKLALFGSFRAYLGHMTTKGHKLIKRAIVSRYNLQPLQPEEKSSVTSSNQKATANHRVFKVPRLSEMLYSTLLETHKDGNLRQDDVAAASVQQPTRSRREHYICGTGSVSATPSKRRVRAVKARSESESSAVPQRKFSFEERNSVVLPVAVGDSGNATVGAESSAKTELQAKTKLQSMSGFESALTEMRRVNDSTSELSGDAASVGTGQGVCSRVRSSSAAPTVNRFSVKSEEEESDCFYDCDEVDEGAASSHSSSSSSAEDTGVEALGSDSGESTSEDENDEGKNEAEEEEDEVNDLCDEILAAGENECNPMLSDEEMDASVLKELMSDGTNGLNEAGVVKSNDENGTITDEDRVIVRHLIVVRGIPRQALQKKHIMFTTFSGFGEIHRTYVKKTEPDTLYILVLKNPEVMYQKLKDNLQNLRIKLGAEEISVEYNTRSSNGPAIRIELAPEIQSLFANANELRDAVHLMMQVYENEAKSPYSLARIHKLEATVAELANSLYRNMVPTKVHIFGSRVTGLATEKSDVDIYLQLGNSFTGCIYTNTILQQRLVLAFSNRMKMFPAHFQNVISVPFARVPIVKFTDVHSGLNCDLSFKSGLSTMNSILVRTYLELDERVKFLVCAVKLWMKLNNFADRHLFTTYAQIWMVLFFLMQAEIAVIPTVLSLRHMLPQEEREFSIEGWNCAFPNISKITWRSACTFSKEELLTKFFEFYSNSNLRKYVLCTLTGLKIEKKHFLDFYDNLPPTFKQYKFKVKTDAELKSRIEYDFEGLCVQDPFDHSHNLTKTINSKKFVNLADIFRETLTILKK